MICVSLSCLNPDRCRTILRTVPMAEVRLDLVDWTEEEIRRIFALPVRLIATCRPGRFSSEIRRRRLAAALEAGASYVDIEAGAAPAHRTFLFSAAENRGCGVILSHHDFRSTPSAAALERFTARGLGSGADIVKIACRVRTNADALRILSLYSGSRGRSGKILAFGLGRQAAWTRLAAPLLGAPFTFARPDGGEGTAEGQVAFKEMGRMLRVLSGGKP